MIEVNRILRLLRIMALGATSLFALIALILAALVTHFSESRLGGFFTFAALAIATSLLTLLTLPAMLIISFLRKGAFTSMVVFEISWLWFLWILWLSVGGSSSNIYFVGGCGRYSVLGSDVEAACNEASALSAFGFLSFLSLLFYHSILATLAFRQHLRGFPGVWTKDVTENDFTAIQVNHSQVAYDPKVSPTYATQYPPGNPVPVAQQQVAGSYMQPVGSPYPQSTVSTGSYLQPQAVGSFTQPTHPHPQV